VLPFEASNRPFKRGGTVDAWQSILFFHSTVFAPTERSHVI
jgi:hypothetical protein